jgi:hypothetical protein
VILYNLFAAWQQASEPIPIPAWEQAVIVALFALIQAGFLVGVFAFVRSNNNFINRMVNQLQGFINARDEDWQEYWEKREGQFDQRNRDVVMSVKEISEAVRTLTEFTQTHHAAMMNGMVRMDERTKTKSARLAEEQEAEKEAAIRRREEQKREDQ